MMSVKLLLTALLAHTTQAHVVLTYPLWRANNLVTNATFPWGMQWSYPCGGVNPTTNRTYWPIDGGAVAFQPGWFQGHETGLIYINLGLGEQPENYSLPLSFFHIQGPTDRPYPATVCQPLVRIPDAIRQSIKSGDQASIQLVEASKHGAAQYTCADIIFTDDLSLVPEVNSTNCFNSSNIIVSPVTLPRGNISTTNVGREASETKPASGPDATLPPRGSAGKLGASTLAVNLLTLAVGAYFVGSLW